MGRSWWGLRGALKNPAPFTKTTGVPPTGVVIAEYGPQSSGNRGYWSISKAIFVLTWIEIRMREMCSTDNCLFNKPTSCRITGNSARVKLASFYYFLLNEMCCTSDHQLTLYLFWEGRRNQRHADINMLNMLNIMSHTPLYEWCEPFIHFLWKCQSGLVLQG